MIHKLIFKFYLWLAVKLKKSEKGNIYFKHVLVWKYSLPVAFNIIYMEETASEFIFYCDTYPRPTGNLFWYSSSDFVVGLNTYTLHKSVQYETTNQLDSWVKFTTPKISVIPQKHLIHTDY